MEMRLAPTPWWAGSDDDAHIVFADNGMLVADCGRDDGDAEMEACHAQLVAAAPDHAMFARALLRGLIRWEPFRGFDGTGEVCCLGLRYTTKLDEFGVPVLNDMIRAAIAQTEKEGE